MKTHRIMFATLIIVVLALTSFTVFAQEAGQPIIIGDSNSEALQVVQEYLNTRNQDLLAEDAVFTDQSTVGEVQGRDAITQTQNTFYGEAFTDAAINPMRFIVTDNTVVAEFEFTGTNTGPYLGNPATGAQVNLPIVGIYQVENGQITSINRYYDAGALQYQLGYYPYPYGYYGVAPYAPATEVAATLSNITDYPNQFYGDRVTVDGLVGEAVGVNGFIFYDNDLIANDEVVVVPAAQDTNLDFVQYPNARIRVTGTVQPFNVADLSSQTGFTFDESAFNDTFDQFAVNDELPVILATSIRNLSTVATIPNIDQNPEPFYGNTVTLDGSVGEPVGNMGFELYADQLIGVAGTLLVVDQSGQMMDFAANQDERVRITGTVHPFVAADLENEFGFDLQEDQFTDYENQPVVVANTITPLQ